MILAALRRTSLVGWMLLAMVAGILLGWLAPQTAKPLSVVTSIFLRLVKSVIAPLLFGVLVKAISQAGGGKDLGRLGWKSVLYFEVTSSIALVIGWAFCFVLQPGACVRLQSQSLESGKAPDFAKLITELFPASIFDAMARGDVLQITLFCTLFGVACASIGAKAEPVVTFAGALAAVAFRYTVYVMYLAPPAVCAAMAATVAESGGAVAGLALFVAAAWGAQAFFCLAVQGPSLALSGLPARTFWREAREPFLVGFATTSSAAALPQTIAAMKNLGIPERIFGLVTPLSLSFNLCGSSIHLAMGTFFVAQAAGIRLSLAETLAILTTLKLTSKGVAGIPRANFVVLAGLFSTFHLPLEGLTILLGLDALIDPVRTSVNVLGHCVASPVIARWEGVEWKKLT
ncbi:MAG: dicarboxylate/amino acid:cation symporter [Bryobacteraceae bacterium]